MTEIYNINNLDELSIYLKGKDREQARIWLLSQFDILYDYKNIKEWNELVRVCEALRIVGWGERAIGS